VRLSDVSIERPVLATVMSLLIVVAGATAWFALPVREYPDVDRPVVSVTTVHPGASPLTVEATVTEPLEQVLNGIEGIRSIQSTSAFGQSSIDVEFETGRDIDLASTDVSNAIQRGLGQLPEEAERPVVRKAGANSRPIMWISVLGEAYNPVDLTDLADRVVRTPLQLLPGVARVVIGGERRYAMRVWLDPSEMAARGVDALDVRRAIVESNLQLPAGEIEAETRKYTIEADALLADPRAYERIVIREDGDTPVRIEDVGRVELGSESYDTITRWSSEPIVGVGIVRQSRANEIAVTRAVRDALPTIRENLPQDVRLEVAVDNSIFVEASLAEVGKTLGIAFAIVVLVNLFFLRSKTTTSIAAVAIPIALVGTFAVMQVLGFSVNVLTLLALVLAIGLLVDDSIVVMENVYRRQERGEAPERAARNGSREVGFPVIATTVSVIAVLVPLSLMGGNTGRLFREFALSMAGAVAISTFVALSLVPSLCARFLAVQRKEGSVSRAIDGWLRAWNAGYERILAAALRRRVFSGLLLLATVAGTAGIFRALPDTFVPTEDRGVFFTLIRAPEGSTSAYTDHAMGDAEAAIAELPGVHGYFSAIGLGLGRAPSSALGSIFTRLVPWSEREVKQQELVQRLYPVFSAIPEALVFPLNPPSLGQRSVNDVEVVLKSSGTTLEELDIVFDRERAADVGVPVAGVAESLRLLVSQNAADEFVLRNKQYDVITALAAGFRSVPEQLGDVHVRAASGRMVPLASLIEPRPGIGPATLNHYDLERSASLTGSLAEGATLGRVLGEVRRIAAEEAPRGFSVALAGISREFVEASGTVYLTFAIALLVIYLVLAAQFESFVHPVTILLSVPLASFGALLSLYATGNTMNLYSQIGLVLLLGLVTKNSILLVDFANQARARSLDHLDALREAGKVRFRPILMTSVTSILGAMPLALATGAGAESRRPIGAAVVGGLLFSTAFTLVVIPVVHYGVTRAAERLGLRTIPPALEMEDA